jgi:hypothetical protein
MTATRRVLPPKRCVDCDCPLILLRGERRRHCARCGRETRPPKACAPCATSGCAGMVDPSRSLTGVCVACRARRSTLRAAVETTRRRGSCAECDAALGRDNLTGYCATCAGVALKCRVDGCEARVASYSVTRLCRQHNRSELRRRYGVGRS